MPGRPYCGHFHMHISDLPLSRLVRRRARPTTGRHLRNSTGNFGLSEASGAETIFESNGARLLSVRLPLGSGSEKVTLLYPAQCGCNGSHAARHHHTSVNESEGPILRLRAGHRLCGGVIFCQVRFGCSCISLKQVRLRFARGNSLSFFSPGIPMFASKTQLEGTMGPAMALSGGIAVQGDFLI